MTKYSYRTSGNEMIVTDYHDDMRFVLKKGDDPYVDTIEIYNLKIDYDFNNKETRDFVAKVTLAKRVFKTGSSDLHRILTLLTKRYAKEKKKLNSSVV